MILINNIDELKKMGVELFECRSPRLADKIIQEVGLFPFDTYRHKNGKLCKVFLKTEAVKEVLKEWKANKPVKEEVN